MSGPRCPSRRVSDSVRMTAKTSSAADVSIIIGPVTFLTRRRFSGADARDECACMDRRNSCYPVWLGVRIIRMTAHARNIGTTACQIRAMTYFASVETLRRGVSRFSVPALVGNPRRASGMRIIRVAVVTPDSALSALIIISVAGGTRGIAKACRGRTMVLRPIRIVRI